MAGATGGLMATYGWMPCFACGSQDHYLDHCPDAWRYWQALDEVEEELQRPIEGGQELGENPGEES